MKNVKLVLSLEELRMLRCRLYHTEELREDFVQLCQKVNHQLDTIIEEQEKKNQDQTEQIYIAVE